MKTPLISIIIPVWNAGSSVRYIVNAITSQSFDDFELLLIDDGSSDDTLSVLHDLEKSDARIHVYTKQNGGPSSARNIGLEKAVGRFIQFYDSDDSIPDGALSAIASAIRQYNNDVFVFGWQIDLQSPQGLVKNYKQIAPQQKVVTERMTEYILRSLGSSGTLYNLWNKLFRADIIRENNLRFREDLRFGEDVLFSLEYFKHIHSLATIPDITYHYLTNSKTSVFASSSINPEYRIANDEAVVSFVEHPNAVEYDLLQWLRWRWLMSYWSFVAASHNPSKKKRQLIRQFSAVDIPLIKTPRYIGLKKFVLQAVAYVIRYSIVMSLFMGWLFNILRKTMIFMKTRLK